MGQAQTSVIMRQNALNLAQKYRNKRMVNNTTEINECLSLTLVLDQLSFELSSINYNISNTTINPLSYEPIILELLQKENRYQAEYQILQKYQDIRNTNHQNLQQDNSPKIHIKRKDNLNQQQRYKQKHTIDDFYISNKLESNPTKCIKPLQSNVYDKEIYQQKEVTFLQEGQQQNQNEKQNGQKQITENFSDDEIFYNSSLSISQNFAEFQQNQGQIDEKSYLQNNKFWSSDHSSTFIDFQINNLNNQIQHNKLSQKELGEQGNDQKNYLQIKSNLQNPNQRITNQQSFGAIKTLYNNYQPQISHLTTSPTVFSQNKLIKQQQIYNNQNVQQIPIDSNQNLGYTQLHSNKKQNSIIHQINMITSIHQSQNSNNLQNNQQINLQQQQQLKYSNFHHSASPQAQIQQSQVQQKESMRQQFDRLLRENKQQKQQKLFKGENLQNLKSPRKPEIKKNKNQNIKNQQINSPKNDKIPKKQKLISSQSPIQTKLYQKQGLINNGIGYLEMNNIKKKYHRSPDQLYSPIKDQRQIQQKIQEKQQNNFNLNQLNLKIQNLPNFNQCFEDKSERLQGQKKQDVSNLQTAMTQNISPSERGLRNKPLIKDEIYLNDLSEYEENSINLDELANYRGSQVQNFRKISD